MNLGKFITNDRRKSIRFKTNIPCLIDNEIKCTLIDLSLDGAKILPSSNIKENEFELKFQMYNVSFNIKCSRVSQIGECMSVEFIKTQKGLKDSLHRILSIVNLGEDII